MTKIKIEAPLKIEIRSMAAGGAKATENNTAIRNHLQPKARGQYESAAGESHCHQAASHESETLSNRDHFMFKITATGRPNVEGQRIEILFVAAQFSNSQIFEFFFRADV